MKKLISVAAALALVILAVGYFVITPLVQINNYKEIAATKHAQLNEKLVRVYDSFKRGVFTSTNSSSASDKADVQVARDAVQDARDALNASTSSLTSFTKLPLLSWNNKYRQAAATNASEETYIKKARTLLADYQTLVDFTTKENAFNTQVEEATKSLDKINENDTPAAMSATIDATTAKLQPLVNQDKALNPPSYLKAHHDQLLANINRLIASLRDLSSAARTLDLAKIITTSTDIDKISSDVNHEGQDFITKLQTQSPIERQINDLRTTNTSIAAGFAKF